MSVTSATVIKGTIYTEGNNTIWKPDVSPFKNREDAGELLAQKLLKTYGEELHEAVILGVPRGGMIFAQKIAEAIRNDGGSPTLNVVISRKIHAPSSEDYAVGAVTEQGEALYVDRLVSLCHIDTGSQTMKDIVAKVQKEVADRVSSYRKENPLPSLEGKVVVIVDGVVSGSTMAACARSIAKFSQGKGPQRVIVATPLLNEKGKNTVKELGGISPQNICKVVTAAPFHGAFWNSDDFYQDQAQKKESAQLTTQQILDILRTFREDASKALIS
jgi:putative phosphoribosyl transferase